MWLTKSGEIAIHGKSSQGVDVLDLLTCPTPFTPWYLRVAKIWTLTACHHYTSTIVGGLSHANLWHGGMDGFLLDFMPGGHKSQKVYLAT